MVKKGSRVVLRTKDAIYSTCEVVAISKENVTVTFCAGVKRDRSTGEYQVVNPTETIPIKKIVCMSERI